MAQFDLLIIAPIVWPLMFAIHYYYKIMLKMIIPNFFATKKFRNKKLNFLNSLTSYNFKSLYVNFD